MSTTTPTRQLELHLRPLPPEAWGSRLKRARKLAHLTQEDAAAALTAYYETTGATISRLESLDEVPEGKGRRQLAWALCVSYGVTPKELDLTDEDRPPLAITRAIFEDAAQRTALNTESAPVIHARSRRPIAVAV